MVLGRFLGETTSNCCRVCSCVESGYYGLSLSVGLLHEAAQVPSYKATHLFAINSRAAAFGTKWVLPNLSRQYRCHTTLAVHTSQPHIFYSYD